jgi:hypothetical protein
MSVAAVETELEVAVMLARSVLNRALFMNGALNSHLHILFRLE